MARKSRKAVARERAEVLRVLEASTIPLSVVQIHHRFAETTGHWIAQMTLRARLRELVELQLARPVGGMRAVRFIAVQAGAAGVASATDGSRPSEPLPSPLSQKLSIAAQRARSLVQLPRSEKNPVVYRVEFLESYLPGTTWYLPQATRDHLRHLGRTAYEGQPAGTYARDIMQRLIIDLSWGSSRLEGAPYTRIDTEEVLLGGDVANMSPTDRQMILNHKAAIEFLVENAGEIGFNRYTVLGLHALLSENLMADRADEGSFRTRPVSVGDSAYTPTAIPQLIEEQFDAILAKASAIPDPLEQSFFMMVHLPYLQPFMDANKRTSRLVANISLIQANICPLSFVDVPEDLYTEGVLAVYENNDVALLRDVFVWAYERSCAQFKVLREAMGEPDPIRLNYRNQLRSVVRDAVKGVRWPAPHEISRAAEALGVPEDDRDAFAAEVDRELHALRSDLLPRYGLRPSEFTEWERSVDRKTSAAARVGT